MSAVLAEADSHSAWLEPLFDVAFAAPGGMTRLRQLILTLAMQGKLVPQDPKEVPVSESLKQIASERAALVKAGKIRQVKGSSPIADSEKPYTIPGSWKWTRLRDICHDWGQKTPDKRFTYIDVGGIDNVRGEISNDVQVLEPAAAPSRARKLVKAGTVIYSTVRPYLLNVAIVEQDYKPEAIASTAFAILHPHAFVSSRFVYHYLRSPSFVRYVESTQKGVAYPAISDGEFFTGVFPLPPFEEQKRIVDRIDELLSRCDELELQRNVQETKRHEARAAAVRQWLAGDDAGAVLLGEHFATLISTREDVIELRKAVLQLAVMGKLVAQDPGDAPASELLKQIAAEKTALVKAGRIRAPKPLEPILDAEKPYAIPAGWVWARLGEIGVWKSGSTPSRTNSKYYGGKIPWVKSGEVKQRRITGAEECITPLALKECSLHINPKGSVLVSMYGANIGDVGILDIEAATNQAVCACQAFTNIDKRYLLNLISSLKPNFISQGAGAAQPNISREKIIATVIPLPPLAEQKRIVARIDQLMQLCDVLERNIDATQAKQTELLEAVMARV